MAGNENVLRNFVCNCSNYMPWRNRTTKISWRNKILETFFPEIVNHFHEIVQYSIFFSSFLLLENVQRSRYDFLSRLSKVIQVTVKLRLNDLDLSDVVNSNIQTSTTATTWKKSYLLGNDKILSRPPYFSRPWQLTIKLSRLCSRCRSMGTHFSSLSFQKP